jgi:hypothetical protein
MKGSVPLSTNDWWGPYVVIWQLASCVVTWPDSTTTITTRTRLEA